MKCHSANLSKYLPDNYAAEPIGLIAGKGEYPILTAAAIQKAGLPLRVVSFAGETDTHFIAGLPSKNHIQIKVGQLGKLLKSLDKLGCRYAIMAGQITPKRLFHGLQPDLKTLRILNSLKTRNAETIFGAIASEIESIGIHMLDARAFLDNQLSNLGNMTTRKTKVDQSSIDHGIQIAKGIAELDIGQGVVVRKGTVLAVEAYEGTDSMLRRAGTFKTDDLLFVKTTKHKQDYRFDVPVFGSRTLEIMHETGIQTAALEADRVILLNKAELLQKADSLNITLLGYTKGKTS
ncbi:MAG: LpxI family protein [Coraliomargaritaceae bacterium]